jgi:two-component system sensor histidine kinase MprB
VLVAVVAVSAIVFLVVRDDLRDRIDASLRDHIPGEHDVPTSEADAAATAHVPLVEDVFLQVVDRDGQILTSFDGRPLPVGPAVRAVARGERVEAWFDAEVDGTPVRVLVTSPEPGIAVQVGRSLAEVDETLRRLLLALVAISVAAIALAALIGRLVAAAAIAPVHRVARAAEAVARTGDLSQHLDIRSSDDLGRLARSFNTMLDTLEDSLAQQRRLVADASHELRTPLATVRTNVEVLARVDQLDAGERDALIRDTVAQIGELTRLVGDLVELARGEGESEPFTTVDLHELAHSAVDAAGRSHPEIGFRLEGSTSLVRGAPGRITRALSNLVDNAAKWSPPGSTVETTVDDGSVTVRDDGPGIHPDDLPHIFDRFYRSPAARTTPGSGLGLAIVQQVADAHGGTITATSTPGRGARFVLRFPGLPTEISSTS